MKPETWQRIEQLYHAARELDEDKRETFLRRETSGDVDLVESVNELLDSDRQAGEFLAKNITGAALEVFSHAGHAPFITEQERFIGVVKDFLRNIEG